VNVEVTSDEWRVTRARIPSPVTDRIADYATSTVGAVHDLVETCRGFEQALRVARRRCRPVKDYDGSRPCVPYSVLRELLVAIERRRWASFDFGGMDAVSADAVGGRPEVTL
jgi:hypothetical protein